MYPPSGSPENPPNPARSCSGCGAADLLTPVRILPPGTMSGERDGEGMRQDGADNAPPRAVLLCPACLSESLNDWRTKGGKIEARLDGGRVVRW